MRPTPPTCHLALLALLFGCAGGSDGRRQGEPGTADSATSDGGSGDGGSGDGGSGDSGSGDAGTGDSGDGGTPAEPDDCDGVDDPKTPLDCPDPSAMTLTEGDGLLAIAADGYVLWDESGWDESDAILGALETTLLSASVSDVLASANRTADVLDSSRAEGFVSGFRWNSGDEDVTYWIPQGVTGSFDADPSGVYEGHTAVLVSWHYDSDEGGTTYDKGVRVSFVDRGDESSVIYRHVLLVEPAGSAAAPDYQAVPVHAGGIAWVGDLLYVADTNEGLRVFDLSRMLEVDTDVDDIGCDGAGSCGAWGYRYVLPQVSRYALPDCSCAATFSFVALDASTSPPSLVTGAYDKDSIAELLHRWPLDATSGLLAGGAYTRATEAYVAQQDKVQGAASMDGDWWLSCSSQSGDYGLLYATGSGVPSTAYDWVDGPEDLAVDAGNGWLWSASEDVGDRTVFAVELAAVR